MLTKGALEQLAEHQARVAALLERVHRALGDSLNVESARLVEMRWELMHVLSEYQTFKHTEIFDEAIRTGNPPEAEMGARMKAHCNKLAASYTDHARRWTLLSAISRWPDYRHDSMTMIVGLMASLAEERRGITTLLARMDRRRER